MPENFIGTDIISVPRIEKSINSSNGMRFTKRVFTDEEIKYCNSKLNSSIHFAGRFAAKEAIMKALLSSEVIESINMRSIEILTGKKGKPEVNLNIEISKNIKCKVSISHCDDYAIAFAFLEIY